jgi:hypothetical protein
MFAAGIQNSGLFFCDGYKNSLVMTPVSITKLTSLGTRWSSFRPGFQLRVMLLIQIGLMATLNNPLICLGKKSGIREPIGACTKALYVETMAVFVINHDPHYYYKAYARDGLRVLVHLVRWRLTPRSFQPSLDGFATGRFVVRSPANNSESKR